MNIETQEKISKLLREQAEKLGKALQALKRIRRLQHSRNAILSDATEIARNTLTEISSGENPQDL